jgi:hypothetical protein
MRAASLFYNASDSATEGGVPGGRRADLRPLATAAAGTR